MRSRKGWIVYPSLMPRNMYQVLLTTHCSLLRIDHISLLSRRFQSFFPGIGIFSWHSVTRAWPYATFGTSPLPSDFISLFFFTSHGTP